MYIYQAQSIWGQKPTMDMHVEVISLVKLSLGEYIRYCHTSILCTVSIISAHYMEDGIDHLCISQPTAVKLVAIMIDNLDDYPNSVNFYRVGALTTESWPFKWITFWLRFGLMVAVLHAAPQQKLLNYCCPAHEQTFH